MRSKTSFFNGTLFRKNLTRFWPLWGGASFLGSLFPLAMLLQLMRYGEISAVGRNPMEFTEAYYIILSQVVPIVSLLYAILCAMVVWSYLYNARSVGLMHALPIRREGLFITNFLSGMAMQLIPYAVVGALCVLVSLACGCLEPVGLLVTILGVLGESFFYFASATLAAFVTGNIFALPAFYFLLHFLAVLLDWLVSTFATGFLFGLSGSYSGAVEWLSPTVYLINQVDVDRTYEEVFVRDAGSVYGGYTHSVLSAVHLENVWLIGVYALAGVVLLALAYALYRRRRSESAGDVVAVMWMKPVFRFGLAGLAALLGGQLLYTLFWEQFQSGRYYETPPMLVCMIAAGVIGYYIASMLLAKALRVFRGSWKGVALVAVGCAVLCGVLHFDVLGVSARVPEISRVEKVTFQAADNHYTFYPGEEDALLEQVRELHQAIVKDQAYIRANESGWRDAQTVYASGINLTYYLTNGLRVERDYLLPLTGDRMAQEGTYDHLLDQLINSDAMKAKRLHVNDSRYTVNSGYLYLDKRNESLDLNSREAAAVLEAVGRDAAAGTWGTCDWFGSGSGGDYAMGLELGFTYPSEYGDGIASDWITITIRPGMDSTVSCLKDLGLITDEDLVTYGELYPENYNDAELEWVDPKAYVFYDTEEAVDLPAGAAAVTVG